MGFRRGGRFCYSAGMDIQPWTVKDSRYLLRDPWLTVRADSCLTPQGVPVEPYYVLEYPDWVFMAVFNPDGHIMVLRLYRHGNGKINLEMPSGRMETDDGGPEETARRELLEETGHATGRWARVATLTPNSATHANRVHCMVGFDARPVAAPTPDQDEHIAFEFVPVPRLIGWIDEGRFDQALHIATVYHALRHTGALRVD
jgi:8-oxo-dGTP pyrophosphatase MutT (NUDIX family)